MKMLATLAPGQALLPVLYGRKPSLFSITLKTIVCQFLVSVSDTLPCHPSGNAVDRTHLGATTTFKVNSPFYQVAGKTKTNGDFG